MKYKIIVDCGKPYAIDINTDKELEENLKELRLQSETDPYLDVIILNEKGDDITEDQFIQEMI